MIIFPPMILYSNIYFGRIFSEFTNAILFLWDGGKYRYLFLLFLNKCTKFINTL